MEGSAAILYFELTSNVDKKMGQKREQRCALYLPGGMARHCRLSIIPHPGRKERII